MCQYKLGLPWASLFVRYYVIYTQLFQRFIPKKINVWYTPIRLYAYFINNCPQAMWANKSTNLSYDLGRPSASFCRRLELVTVDMAIVWISKSNNYRMWPILPLILVIYTSIYCSRHSADLLMPFSFMIHKYIFLEKKQIIITINVTYNISYSGNNSQPSIAYGFAYIFSR